MGGICARLASLVRDPTLESSPKRRVSMKSSCCGPTRKCTSCRPCSAIATCCRSKIPFYARKRSCVRGQYFHSSDAAIRGHVFCSFLALAMQKHLDDLSREAGATPEWKDLLRRSRPVTARPSCVSRRRLAGAHGRDAKRLGPVPSRPYCAAAARQATRAAKGCAIIDIHPKTPRPPQA